jgi:hypothetical protein
LSATIEDVDSGLSTTGFWLKKIKEEHQAEQRRADAALVREAGCICISLGDPSSVIWKAGTDEWSDPRIEDIAEHDPRCPEALAARIEAGEVSHG